MKNPSVVASLLLAGVCSFAPDRAFAQSPAQQSAEAIVSFPVMSDENIQLFRKDVRSERKKIIAANLDLTEGEAEKFWPLFDQYTAELVKIHDRKYALLQAYAENYTTMTDEQAESYIKGRGEVEDSIAQVRLKYVPLFRKVLSGRSTALFFQLDWRLTLIMDLQVTSQTPLVEQ